jgi:hypothetical protein
MSLFRESDRRVHSVPCNSVEASRYLEANDDAASELEIVRYSAPARTVRDRLELMGFTLPTALKVFEKGVAAERVRHSRSIESLRQHLGPDFEDEDGPILQHLTAAHWMDGLTVIRDRGLHISKRNDAELASIPATVTYMLKHDLDGWWNGFPSYEIRHAIRLALEVCADDVAVYDLTDLVLSEMFSASDDMVAHADSLLTEDVARTRRLVVLTEGSTDRWMIERSLRLLYPHLADYFRFMDFEGARVAGGAGPLAGMVKAFVGAGIANRVVALFDNDTAGAAAIRSLSQVSIPPNIKVMQYPSLPLASEYPTLGPSGDVVMNVNGLACSIELYLGRDVLMNDGRLHPVQWKGFDEGLRRYQGEITNKSQIQERFEAKLRQAEMCPSEIKEHDWSGMSLILEQLLAAFHADDALELLANEDP